MLRNPYGKVSRQTSFAQQLNLIKHPPSSEELTKTTEHFRLVLSILNILIEKYPRMTDEILVIKKCMVKWQEHSQEETVSKNRQILNMRDNLIVYVKQQVGVVFEQIGEYLKSLTEYYRDDDIRQYYVRYLTALKKIEWKRTATKDGEMQTEANEFQISRSLGTERSLKDKTECSIEGVFIPPKYKQIDLHKYILLKEQNLQLQRKIDKLGTRVNQLELLNKNLTQQIDRLTDANYAYRSDKQDYLDQIQKLTNILNRMKQEQNQRLNRVHEQSLNFTESEALFKQSRMIIKRQYEQTINNAEESLARKEELFQIQQMEKQFNGNYMAARNQHEFQTVKKENQKEEESDKNVELRFLFVQALAIESFLSEKVEELQLLQEGSIQLDFSQSH